MRNTTIRLLQMTPYNETKIGDIIEPQTDRQTRNMVSYLPALFPQQKKLFCVNKVKMACCPTLYTDFIKVYFIVKMSYVFTVQRKRDFTQPTRTVRPFQHCFPQLTTVRQPYQGISCANFTKIGQ